MLVSFRLAMVLVGLDTDICVNIATSISAISTGVYEEVDVGIDIDLQTTKKIRDREIWDKHIDGCMVLSPSIGRVFPATLLGVESWQQDERMSMASPSRSASEQGASSKLWSQKTLDVKWFWSPWCLNFMCFRNLFFFPNQKKNGGRFERTGKTETARKNPAKSLGFFTEVELEEWNTMKLMTLMKSHQRRTTTTSNLHGRCHHPNPQGLHPWRCHPLGLHPWRCPHPCRQQLGAKWCRSWKNMGRIRHIQQYINIFCRYIKNHSGNNMQHEALEEENMCFLETLYVFSWFHVKLWGCTRCYFGHLCHWFECRWRISTSGRYNESSWKLQIQKCILKYF